MISHQDSYLMDVAIRTCLSHLFITMAAIQNINEINPTMLCPDMVVKLRLSIKGRVAGRTIVENHNEIKLSHVPSLSLENLDNRKIQSVPIKS